jgi:hypothetical protein
VSPERTATEVAKPPEVKPVEGARVTRAG